jgi:hypothetical protein
MNNISCTWNVFSAARRAGVNNIVWASSETVLGLPFGIPPPYLPVDEDYPPRPESTYSLVKTLEEAMAVQLCRWNSELKMIGLRFSNVMEPADYARFPSFDDDPGSRKWNLWGCGVIGPSLALGRGLLLLLSFWIGPCQLEFARSDGFDLAPSRSERPTKAIYTTIKEPKVDDTRLGAVGSAFTRSPVAAALWMAAMTSWRRTASAKSGTVWVPLSRSAANAA